MKTLVFPENCTTAQQRYEYACRAKEEMILEHNLVSRMVQEGLTQEQYDSGAEPLRRDPSVPEKTIVLPVEVKAVIRFTKGEALVPDDFRAYVRTSFHPRMEAVHEALAECRKELENLYAKTAWPVDTGKVVADVAEIEVPVERSK